MSRNAKFGVIGLGTWGERLARVLAEYPGADLAAVCDISELRARLVAQATGARMYYTSAENLLEDESITAVCVATPDHVHMEVALAAARAGKHLLVEKPLATTVEEAAAIVEAARRGGVMLMVNFHHRWHPAFAAAREAVADGRVGAPLLLSCRWSHSLELPTAELNWPSRTSVAWFAGTHAVDVVRWLCGDEVMRVYANSGSAVLDTIGIATPDFYTAQLEFAHGAVATVECCWTLPPGGPSKTDIRGEVVGAEGALYFDASHHRTMEQYTRTGLSAPTAYPDMGMAPIVHGRCTGAAVESVRHFVDCVLHDRPPAVTGDDGLAVTRIVAAIHESARSRQPVVLNSRREDADGF
jgi:predicted dehydrogenase